jgi:hypothetical protein
MRILREPAEMRACGWLVHFIEGHLWLYSSGREADVAISLAVKEPCHGEDCSPI